MVRRVQAIEGWPRLMQSGTAAAYVGESSVDAFQRAVGTIWPKPVRIRGKGQRWLREDLDEAVDRLARRADDQDAADIL